MTTTDEAARLKTLTSLGLLDTEPETEFDELVGLAATICDTPISLVTLVDEKRQWFKSAVGTQELRETPREIAFCAHAILNPDLFLVEDATKDPRFAENPLVTNSPCIRFYAGMPLETSNGHRMGTLCVIDTVPRRLDPKQTHALIVLANQVKARMELRLQQRALQTALAEKEAYATEIQASDERFRSFMNNSPFVSYMKDENFRFVFYNQRFADRFGIGMNTWIGKSNEEVFPPEVAEGFHINDRQILESGEPRDFVERSLEDGDVFIWRSHKFPFADRNGRRLIAGVSIDVTTEVEREAELKIYHAELEAANAMLRELAVTDGLTGLSNRRAFEERLAIEISQSRRRHRPLSIVLMDVDDFKLVNDSLGHAAGDTVLCEVARTLGDAIRLPDMAARYGGEEFVVVLPETDMEQAMLFTERLRMKLVMAHWLHQPVTMSMGVATLEADVQDLNHLIFRADEALYQSKRNGKSRATSWSRETVLHSLAMAQGTKGAP